MLASIALKFFGWKFGELGHIFVTEGIWRGCLIHEISRKEFLFQIARFFLISEVCSQIWLNHLMDDHQFSYITKLKKKNPWWHPYVKQKRMSSFIILLNLLSPLLSMIKVQKHTKFEEQLLLHQSIKSMIGNIYFIHVITYDLLPWQK